MNDQRNLILAIAVSIAILLGFQYFFAPPPPQPQAPGQTSESQLPSASTAPGSSPAAPGGIPVEAVKDRTAIVAEALADGGRVKVSTPSLHGSINLVGGRIDDLTLAHYKETPDPASPEIVLLAPAGSRESYYAEFGWVPENTAIPVPGNDTRWQSSATTLTPDQPVVLTWDNGQGLVFERTVAVDADYMFTVTQRVRNTGSDAVRLLPYGLVSRTGTPKTQGFYILHEGPLGVFDGTLTEYDYDDLRDARTITAQSQGGWIGITDKYWLVSLVPDQAQPMTARFIHNMVNNNDRYQVDTLGQAVEVAPGATAERVDRLFAGAKQVRLLDGYADTLGIPNFDLAIDFGWFYFLTKPFFYAIDWIARLIGNFGVAILVFTVIVKAVFFPLANKSYHAMAKMKKLQPKMMELRERAGDDKQRLNQELMALYKREKVNPVSGCLPILVQIPVFFALYKVLFVTIEMRHAPFFGWIQDLSAPDPTTIFNLFGLIPWTPPSMLMLGAWPIIMGLTMWLQMRLNPAPPDPVQAKVMSFLPIVFTFMLASFPAGLVIYWAWNNLLSIAQQWIILRQEGVKA